MATETVDYPLTIVRGQDFLWKLQYLDADENPIDLTGWYAKLQIRRPCDRNFAGAPLLTLDSNTPVPGITLDNLGNITVAVPHAVTQLYVWEEGEYDLFLTDVANFRRKLIQGTVEVVSSVTES